MFDVVISLVQGLGVSVMLFALGFTAPKIAVAAAAYLAIKNNDPGMAMSLVRQTHKLTEETSTLKDAFKLLPKGKSDG